MRNTKKITSGEILLEEYLKPMGLSAYRLAKELHVPETRIHSIIKEGGSISIDTAIRLGAFFKTGTEFWLNLQNSCDIRAMREKNQEKKIAKQIHPFVGLKRMAA